jgi:hypothetical protein
MVDRWPALAETGIPKVLDYPIRSLVSSWCVAVRFHSVLVSFPRRF